MILGKSTVVSKIAENLKEDFSEGKEAHKINGLEEGKTYILHEEVAPDGYEMTESITFTVTTDKETQIIEMKDMPILKFEICNFLN